jgi:hypothetical protein
VHNLPHSPLSTGRRSPTFGEGDSGARLPPSGDGQIRNDFGRRASSLRMTSDQFMLAIGAGVVFLLCLLAIIADSSKP